MPSIIWHSLTRRWVQSLSTLLAVAVGVGILFALYLLYLGVSVGLDTGKKRLGADLLVIPEEAEVEPEAVLFTGAPMNIYMNKELEDKTRKVSGVARVTSHFFTQTLGEGHCTLSKATRLIGFTPEADWVIRPWLRDMEGGDGLADDEILIGSKVEGKKGGKAGILGKEFRVADVMDPSGTSLDESILMPIDIARSLTKETPYLELFWGKYGRPESLISAILVDVEDESKENSIIFDIERLGGVKVVQTSGVLLNIKSQMDILFLIILGGGLLAAVSSVLQFFARFFSLAWDRKGEWGLYRALGATRRDLKLLVVGEALFLNLGGIVTGLALGTILYKVILIFLSRQKAFPFIEPSLAAVLYGLAGIVVIFSLVGVLSAWFPAGQSGKIEPSSAMALGDID